MMNLCLILMDIRFVFRRSKSSFCYSIILFYSILLFLFSLSRKHVLLFIFPRSYYVAAKKFMRLSNDEVNAENNFFVQKKSVYSTVLNNISQKVFT